MSSEVYSSASLPIVRAAARGDVKVINAIYEWFDHKVAGGWPVLVAEDESGVVGWTSYGPFRDKDGYSQTVEHSAYVDLGRRVAPSRTFRRFWFET